MRAGGAIVLGLLAMGLLATFTGVFARGQRALIYPRVFHNQRTLERPPSDVIVLWRELPGSRSGTEAWLLPPLGERSGASPLLVFAHGNGELIDDWWDELRPYRELGFAVLLPEYRGYGRSGGEPTQDDLVSDFVFFIAEAKRRLPLDPTRIVFHGRSLGGGVVAAVLPHVTPRALVLESTFASLTGVVNDLGLPGSIVVDKYPSAKSLATFTGPVLILHGLNDRLVRYAHAELLLQAAPHAELVKFECGHNDLARDERYWGLLARFLAPVSAR